MARMGIGHYRARLGSLGEWAAAGFLARNGVRIVRRNVKVGRGEVDIVAEEAGGLLAVEVKSGVASEDGHPRWNFTDRKAEQVADLARRLGIYRVDLVTVEFRSDGLRLDWHPRVV